MKLGVENDKDVKVMVTPFAGVWIEILIQTDEDHLSMSLPSRECGLKSWKYLVTIDTLLSLPSRECGLKSYKRQDSTILQLSLPSRECGLKCDIICHATAAGMSLPSRECGLKSGGTFG